MPFKPATDSLPQPGDFPVGSLASRAAARLRAQNLHDNRERIEIVFQGFSVRDDDAPTASPWIEASNGSLSRTLFIPSGMNIEEAKRVLDGQGKP